MPTQHGSTVTIDLNCDLGESYGVYTIGQDEALLPYITSANIACGFHAGDPRTMRETVRRCIEAGVSIGAHPGLPDRDGFGRRNMAVTPQEAYDMIVYQVGALLGFVHAAGGTMAHVKPHGALYNMAATDRRLADAIAAAVRDVDSRLILFGLAGSELVRAGEAAGLQTAGEAFADRAYRADGTLMPRGASGAVIADEREAAAQAVAIVRDGKALAEGGTPVPIAAQTLCIHGDSPHALAIVKALRSAFEVQGIAVASVKRCLC